MKTWAERSRTTGFTIIELLVVIGIVALLTTLLSPSLLATRNKAHSTICKGNLSQIGRALAIYVNDHDHYPSLWGGMESTPPSFQTWADRLTPAWTNRNWHCPVYLGEHGVVRFDKPPEGGGEFRVWSSYAYNSFGITDLQQEPKLGLSDLPRSSVHENAIQSPSEMYTVGDTRAYGDKKRQLVVGRTVMEPWLWGGELEPPHAQGYNLLFADGHLDLVKRTDYLYPPRTAAHWNRDNQPHPEVWAGANRWAVQK
jgi:prepilin-type N-terminal cleavage/methylation domain-containing protein/prepilin-type processing-associated H-X9-DG protein